MADSRRDYPLSGYRARQRVRELEAEVERLGASLLDDEGVRRGAAVVATVFGCDEATAWNAYRAGLLAQIYRV